MAQTVEDIGDLPDKVANEDYVPTRREVLEYITWACDNEDPMDALYNTYELVREMVVA